MFKAFLVKYSEIGVKGKNRYIFENALRDQVKLALDKVEGEFEVLKEQGRILIETLSEYDYDEVIDALTHVFGIAGICPALRIEDNSWDNLTKEVAGYVKEIYGTEKKYTFKVEAKRGFKDYPLNSPQICANMGEYLLDNFDNLSVDVHNPDIRLHVEIRTAAYVYSKVIPGVGGMPIGTSGRAMLLLSGGIDSPVAGYMIAKRGVKIDATYFHAPPYTSERAKQKVVDLAKIISKYTGPIDLHIVNFTDIQMYIYDKCPHEELTIIMRRYMMKIAQDLAKKNGCIGLITGESIGQVASQTMQSLNCTNAVCEMPVFRPVIAYDKQDIVDISQKIGAFETSILPYEDCCTTFVAKHPVTKPTLKQIEKSEKKLSEGIDELYEKALKTVETVVIK